VRIAAAMGFDVKKLVPFGGGVHADMGQSRGAQSGEADRHAVWLQAHGLEPKMSPFDPMAVLDEIQRLVPGYDVSRINLLSGNDEQTKLVQIDLGNYQSRADLVVPSNDTLFTSGTLGRYSNTMNSVIERSTKDSEVMAD
jgi:NADH-quinone oxidoreductase subunit G